MRWEAVVGVRIVRWWSPDSTAVIWREKRGRYEVYGWKGDRPVYVGEFKGLGRAKRAAELLG